MKYILGLLCVFVIFGFFCNIKNEKNIGLMDQIKAGMSKEEVISVMGEPAGIGRSVVDSAFQLHYDYSTNLLLRSTRHIIISFSKKGKVLSVSTGGS
jgi:hypothetical protein